MSDAVERRTPTDATELALIRFREAFRAYEEQQARTDVAWLGAAIRCYEATQHGCTQAELAEASGVSIGYISFLLFGAGLHLALPDVEPWKVAAIACNNQQKIAGVYARQMRQQISSLVRGPRTNGKVFERLAALSGDDLTVVQQIIDGELPRPSAIQAESGSDHSAANEPLHTAPLRQRLDVQLVPGIYAYSLPHYLRFPVEPDTGRTLIKVGHSSKDAYTRVATQGHVTSLPEKPLLLRVYPADATSEAERTFHALLSDADHSKNASIGGGSEWFLTSLKFLDSIATSQGLEIIELTV